MEAIEDGKVERIWMSRARLDSRVGDTGRIEEVAKILGHPAVDTGRAHRLQFAGRGSWCRRCRSVQPVRRLRPAGPISIRRNLPLHTTSRQFPAQSRHRYVGCCPYPHVARHGVTPSHSNFLAHSILLAPNCCSLLSNWVTSFDNKRNNLY